LLDVSRIDHDDLSKGAKVFYKYAKEEGDPRGPVTVKLRSRDHEGSFVIVTFGSDERKLYLADDEDYGALSFYVRN
jgi:thioredoxin reductase